MLIREDVPLAPLTTLSVGGPARYFVEATTEYEVTAAVEFAHFGKLPLFVLGGGSNVVISDAGYSGLVLKISINGISDHRDGETVIFNAGAGCDWDALVAKSVEMNCAGLECLSGIPGTVGATPVQNVGAYGQEVSQTIREVRVLNLAGMDVKTLRNDECGFTYRSSAFNTTERGHYVILRVVFATQPGGKPTVDYPDVQKYFAGTEAPTLAQVRQAVLEIRHRKAMLIVPGEEDARSAGSFFKNPVLPQKEFEALSESLATRGLQIPNYPTSAGRKVPAGWLVEHAGFAKGYAKGGAGISRKHSLAIVNRGDATAADIVALKDEIQQRVVQTFGILLEPEPVFVGF